MRRFKQLLGRVRQKPLRGDTDLDAKLSEADKNPTSADLDFYEKLLEAEPPDESDFEAKIRQNKDADSRDACIAGSSVAVGLRDLESRRGEHGVGRRTALVLHARRTVHAAASPSSPTSRSPGRLSGGGDRLGRIAEVDNASILDDPDEGLFVTKQIEELRQQSENLLQPSLWRVFGEPV